MNLAKLVEITNEEYYDLEFGTFKDKGELTIIEIETSDAVIHVDFIFGEYNRTVEGTPGETWIETDYNIEIEKILNCETDRKMIFDRDEEKECLEHLEWVIESKLRE